GGKVENLTKDNPAADSAPRFSPDGKWLAYRAQRRAGFEADKWEIMVTDPALKAKPRSLTANLDRSANDFIWSPDSSAIYFTAEDNGAKAIWAVALEGGQARKVHEGGTNGALSISHDGKLVAFSKAAIDHPPEIWLAQARRPMEFTAARNLSQANA